MSDAELLTTLNTLGVSLKVEGDRLRINAPRGVLTPELQARLSARKSAILTLLNQVSAASDAWPPITQRATDLPRPLSLGQERLWSLLPLTPDACLYNMYLAFRVEGNLDVARLERSFAHLIARHASLRTNFQIVQGEPRQIVRPVGDWQLPVIALDTASDVEAQVRTTIDREIRVVFDPARDPLFRVTALRESESVHYLILVQHHLISDGWSWDVLLNELARAYAGESVDEPGLPVQFADYAEWQREVWQNGAFAPRWNFGSGDWPVCPTIWPCRSTPLTLHPVCAGRANCGHSHLN